MARGFKKAVIAIGESLSGAINIGEGTAIGLQMPAAWDTADITFQASLDGTTWGELSNLPISGVAISDFTITTPVAAKCIPLDPILTLSWNYLKIRSGTLAAAVNQTAARTLKLVHVQ